MEQQPASPHLYNDLIHSIYALVHNDGELPNLLSALDEYFTARPTNDLPEGGFNLISGLLPHVEQANLLLEKISTLYLNNSHKDKLLNHIPLGIALITPQARVISLNARAKAQLEQIQASFEGDALCFAKNSQQAAFQRAVNAVAVGKAQSAPMLIGDLNLWVSHFGEAERVQLAVYFSHRSSESSVCATRMMELYQLTHREAQLSALLCDHHSNLDGAAESMGISINTAKVHMRHIFAKTGTRRVVDLVKMMLANPILTMYPGRNGHQMDLPVTQLSRLPNGRTISWAEYGDPNGRPLLFCHAITGCRVVPAAQADLLKKNNIRLIVPDRAGYGFSSPAKSGCMQQWIDDMRMFLPQIGVDTCYVLGHSTGGAHAMELAAALPDRVGGLTLVSSVVPIREADEVAQMQPVFRTVVNLARSDPQAARAFLKLSLQAMQKNPDSCLGLTDDIPVKDQEVLSSPGFKRRLHSAFRESTRQGTDHLLDELIYLASEWRFDVRSIKQPVRIWHGAEDTLTPPGLMRQLSSRLLHCRPVHWVMGAGFFLRVHHWPEIVKHAARVIIVPLLAGWIDLLTPLLDDCLSFI